jgi:hypothetical protein
VVGLRDVWYQGLVHFQCVLEACSATSQPPSFTPWGKREKFYGKIILSFKLQVREERPISKKHELLLFWKNKTIDAHTENSEKGTSAESSLVTVP